MQHIHTQIHTYIRTYAAYTQDVNTPAVPCMPTLILPVTGGDTVAVTWVTMRLAAGMPAAGATQSVGTASSTLQGHVMTQVVLFQPPARRTSGAGVTCVLCDPVMTQ